MKIKRSWREKLADDKDLPKIGPMRAKRGEPAGPGTCVVPAPREVDELMRSVGKGKLTTIDDIRRCLARKHGATIACPMASGIFAWIAAHAAHEAEEAGVKRITPYWRTLKSNGELNPKYPNGIPDLISRLRAEGHEVVQKGRRYLVVDFDRALARLPSPERA